MKKNKRRGVRRLPKGRNRPEKKRHFLKRLEKARIWLNNYSGNDMIGDYQKTFSVSPTQADIELKIMGFSSAEEKPERENQVKKGVEKSRNFKEVLTEKKIYFETVIGLCLTLMTICLSIVSIQINYNYQQVADRQLKILVEDREAYFQITSETVLQRDGIIKKRYTVENAGGKITGAMLTPIESIVIHCYDKDIKGSYRIIMTRMFSADSGGHSFYDDENKTFEFYGLESNQYRQFIQDLQTKLQKEFNDERLYISQENYLKIRYVNYKNQFCSNDYLFWHNDRLSVANDPLEDHNLIGMLYSHDIDQIVPDIRDAILKLSPD